ncbi:N-acetyltransferase [Oligoflexaceae bacterium]|nr:N-acetyltransferase [Oligoflexaceae bacterium]
MNIEIRRERVGDFEAVDRIIRDAFLSAEHADGNEHELVARLRRSAEFVADLSLVAEVEGEIVGHLILTPIVIVGPTGKINPSLALAPVSVDPKYQKQGIGRELIMNCHKKAKSLGFKSIILLGHPEYYPKFGYEKASLYKINPPFEVPDEAFMVIDLVGDGLKGISGTVKYPNSFGI